MSEKYLLITLEVYLKCIQNIINTYSKLSRSRQFISFNESGHNGIILWPSCPVERGGV